MDYNHVTPWVITMNCCAAKRVLAGAMGDLIALNGWLDHP
jgi:hypothetical protein